MAYHRRRLVIQQFQSTLPRGKRPAGAECIYHSQPDFNPRFREGSDAEGGIITTAIYISIHASAREATAKINKLFPIILIYLSISHNASAYKLFKAIHYDRKSAYLFHIQGANLQGISCPLAHRTCNTIK